MTTVPAILPAILALVATGVAGAQAPPRTVPPLLTGAWEGLMQAPQWPSFLTLTIGADSAGPAVTLEMLGQRMRASGVDASGDRAVVRIGDGPGAVHLRLQRRDDQLDGWLRQGTDSFPVELARVPVYSRPASRVEAWEQDIAAIRTRFLAYDRSFSPAERSSAVALLDSTQRELPTLHDNQVIATLATAIALARNAHTRLYLVRNATELRRLPVRLWWFSDGLRIVRASPEHGALLGCRVDEIDGIVARQARDLVAPAFAGNPQWTDYKTVYSL
ncbi:MAG: hypothetical protein H0X64_15915, partial [Gemmatimonadaceae bacterium]|nr:hypothetical protein [Gemmatimonadaceae bacterium]